MNNDAFADMAETFEREENNSGLTAGDGCPDCENTLHELRHPRDARFDSERHKDAPETEVVCRFHGIQESF